jgi:hypothetical protein
MRVISQDYDVDLDYETSNFSIKDLGQEGAEIIAYNNGLSFIMATYSDIIKAKKAFIEMSKKFSMYFININSGDNKGYSMITDEINYIPDKQFERIEVKEIHNLIYVFPEEKTSIDRNDTDE